MKFKQRIELQTLSRRSMIRPADFNARLRLHCEILPEYAIEKLQVGEPVRAPFSLDLIDTLFPDDGSDRGAVGVTWKRTSKPKAEGIFSIANKGFKSSAGNSHASELMQCEGLKLTPSHQAALIAYIQQSVVRFDGDIALLDSRTSEYLERYMRPYSEWDNCFGDFSIYTHTLRHWLPDLYWGTVFGKAYVDMFGLDCLLSAPAYEVKQLSDEAVYLQLSPNLQDLHDDFDAVQAVRDAVKDHLGRDAFFNVENAYELRSFHLKGQPPAVNNAFRVPNFELISDFFMERPSRTVFHD